MEIKKMVDLETLTQEEKEAIENGSKTEEDLLAEYESAEQEKEEKRIKAEELANNYKIRAEKAEAKLKEPKEEKKEVIAPKTNDSLSQTDLIAILKADVAEEDIEEVVSYASLKKISVADALKSNVIKTILSEKAEQRATANATATNNRRGGSSSKLTPSQILENAKKGDLPESDEEMKILVRARKGLK